MLPAPKVFIQGSIQRGRQTHDHHEHHPGDHQHALGQQQAPFAVEGVGQSRRVIADQEALRQAVDEAVEAACAEIQADTVAGDGLAHADGSAAQHRADRRQQGHQQSGSHLQKPIVWRT